MKLIFFSYYNLQNGENRQNREKGTTNHSWDFIWKKGQFFFINLNEIDQYVQKYIKQLLIL